MLFETSAHVVEIPNDLPISGSRGCKKLSCLRRRAEHLLQRINSSLQAGRVLGYDKAELAALEWAIEHIILYEGLLKKDPESVVLPQP